MIKIVALFRLISLFFVIFLLISEQKIKSFKKDIKNIKNLKEEKENVAHLKRCLVSVGVSQQFHNQRLLRIRLLGQLDCFHFGSWNLYLHFVNHHHRIFVDR